MVVDADTLAVIKNQHTELSELIHGLQRSLDRSDERVVQLLNENAELRKERAVDKKRIDEAHAEINALRLAMQVNNREAAEELARHKIESAAVIRAAVTWSSTVGGSPSVSRMSPLSTGRTRTSPKTCCSSL